MNNTYIDPNFRYEGAVLAGNPITYSSANSVFPQLDRSGETNIYGWVPANMQSDEWIQVTLPEIKTFVKIATMGSHDSVSTNKWVQKYKV